MGRKQYDREFKLSAIKLVLDQGLSIQKVSEDLDVGYNTLNKWIKDYQEDPQGAFPGKGHLRPQDIEVHKLRKRLREVEMERDILKKAVPILAEIRKRNSSASKS
jgi:transposase